MNEQPPIEIDLISALYPEEPLTPAKLEHILQDKLKQFAPNAEVLFRIEERDLQGLGSQLDEALSHLARTGAMETLRNPHCSIRVIENIDYDRHLSYLSEMLGAGGVIDEEMREMADSWESGAR